MTAVPPRPVRVGYHHGCPFGQECPPRPAAPDVSACKHGPARCTTPNALCLVDCSWAAPDATAGDGLRDVLAERDLLQRQLVHMTAERDGLTRKLRDVLAAAARDAELRKRVEAALAELDKQAAVHDMHGLVTAHRPIAARLRRALDVP